MIADLSGCTGDGADSPTGHITLAGVTFDHLELALDGSEAYGFQQGESGLTEVDDEEILERVQKVPLLGVSQDVSLGAVSSRRAAGGC